MTWQTHAYKIRMHNTQLIYTSEVAFLEIVSFFLCLSLSLQWYPSIPPTQSVHMKAQSRWAHNGFIACSSDNGMFCELYSSGQCIGGDIFLWTATEPDATTSKCRCSLNINSRKFVSIKLYRKEFPDQKLGPRELFPRCQVSIDSNWNRFHDKHHTVFVKQITFRNSHLFATVWITHSKWAEHFWSASDMLVCPIDNRTNRSERERGRER